MELSRIRPDQDLAASPPRHERSSSGEASGLTIRQVEKSYSSGPSKVTALRDIHLEIRDGEFFSLLGPSGCGKSTLLRILAGLEAPDSGDVLLNGVSLRNTPPNKRPLNTVFQSYALFPHMTVAKNIAYGLEAQGLDRDRIRRRVGEMLDLIQLLELETRYPGQLSGGQRQRVAIARALAPRPEVLLLDESLSALDRQLRKDMQKELKRIQRDTGVTFLFVTHDQDEAMAMSDTMAILNQGSVVQVGTPLDLYRAPNSRFVAGFIGDTNFIKAKVTDSRTLKVGDQTLTSHHGLPVGECVELAIRPEAISLDPDGSRTAGLDALIIETRLTGGALECVMLLQDGQRVDARLPVIQLGDAPDASTAARLYFDLAATPSFPLSPPSPPHE